MASEGQAGQLLHAASVALVVSHEELHSFGQAGTRCAGRLVLALENTMKEEFNSFQAPSLLLHPSGAAIQLAARAHVGGTAGGNLAHNLSLTSAPNPTANSSKAPPSREPPLPLAAAARRAIRLPLPPVDWLLSRANCVSTVLPIQCDEVNPSVRATVLQALESGLGVCPFATRAQTPLLLLLTWKCGNWRP